jgi:hypothetical protein
LNSFSPKSLYSVSNTFEKKVITKNVIFRIEKSWIMVLDTSGILPSKLQNSLISQDHFSENYFTSSQKTIFCRCAVPFPSVFRSNSQCHKITVLTDNSKILITEVVIPDLEVVPERAHSSKLSGKVL